MTQLEAMALTFAIEAPVAALLAIWFARKPLLGAGAAIAGTTITHPILWAVYYSARTALGALTTPILEGVIIAAETLGYRAIATPRWDEAAVLSLLANAASWGAGELIYATM